jgi:hypothetical protein
MRSSESNFFLLIHESIFVYYAIKFVYFSFKFNLCVCVLISNRFLMDVNLNISPRKTNFFYSDLIALIHTHTHTDARFV